MPSAATSTPPPTLGLMHAVFILAGYGTLLLGPILPLLTAQWHLTDSQAGLLILSQFVGATIGGATLSRKLDEDLLIGLCCGCAGFADLANASGLAFACIGLLLGGFGVGRIIASVNVIAGNRYSSNRAVALTRLNFTWSFGALLSPLVAAWALPHLSLHQLLGDFALPFIVCAIVLGIQRRGGNRPQPQTAPTQSAPFSTRIFLYGALLLFLYGGLETCLSGWLTTYALRYGKTSFVLSEYTLVLLLAGLTAGRALAAWLLLRIRDTTLQRIALVLSAALAAALSAAHQASLIAAIAVLLGIALAPIFPATFAIFLANRPPARIAGIVLAASGLGAAALPSLIGVISTRTGSLQLALTVPVATAIAMLALTALSPKLTAES